MNWCERCGRWFLPGYPVRYVNRPVRAYGHFLEPEIDVCANCLKPDEMPNV